ncbi:MAG: hypothetical protein M3R61_10455 [Chloroflexota bacterium]|nr:hypothetical protein [Chloroflexota bacterium]
MSEDTTIIVVPVNNTIIGQPFYVADAAFYAWLENASRQTPLAFERTHITTGSVEYRIAQDGRGIGTFDIRAMSAQRTVITTNVNTETVEQSKTQLHTILQDILDNYKQQLREMTTQEATLTTSALREPQPGDTIDAVLDWRDAERKRGRRHTLEALAQKSGLSLSTLKKHSALRKARKEL